MAFYPSLAANCWKTLADVSPKGDLLLLLKSDPYLSVNQQISGLTLLALETTSLLLLVLDDTEVRDSNAGLSYSTFFKY